MENKDIRWQQRYSNFNKALSQLEKFVEKKETLNELEELGVIKAFEFTFEMAWRVMKDYFEYQGNPTITGSRDAFREAFNKGVVLDGEEWMNMIKDRNETVHTYNELTADKISDKVIHVYFKLFKEFQLKMKSFL